MAEYLVLGMGSPSDMGEFTREYESLEGMTPSDYAKSKGVKVLPKPATLSCHNTPDRPHPFAADLEGLAEGYDSDNNPNKVVAVLGGGMSLQLPAIVAAHTRTVPIIGVPFYSSSTLGGGLDALTACSNLPGGRAILGSAPIHHKEQPSLDKAVQMAVFMLKDAQYYEISSVYSASHERQGDFAHDFFLELGIAASTLHHFNCVDDLCDQPGMNLCITDDLQEMYGSDKNFFLTVQTILPKKGLNIPSKYQQFVEYSIALGRTKRTLAVAKPGNAAEFMARVIGLDDMKVREALGSMFVDKVMANGPKYGDKYVPIIEESFE